MRAAVVTGGARVSLIATVLNEQHALHRWLAALERQSRQPDEVIIVDGGSSDDTWEILASWKPPFPTTLLRCEGATIAAGRNAAIDAALGEIVAVTDAGTLADERWLERLTDVFGNSEVDVAAGFFRPALDTRWARALAATTLPDVAEIQPERFPPSSRSLAFRRGWFVAGLRYPVWLDYCEDLVWDLALRRAGAHFAFVPDAVVEYRVRPSVSAHFRQYARYARGDGKAGLFARRHTLRYAAYGTTALIVARCRPRALLLVGVLGLGYLRRPLLRLWRWDRAAGVTVVETLWTAPLVPVVRVVGDMAKLWGYPHGLSWRQRQVGGLGWRTSWRRITPAGLLWRPAALTRRNRRPTSSPDV